MTGKNFKDLTPEKRSDQGVNFKNMKKIQYFKGSREGSELSEESTIPSDCVKSENDGTTAVSTEERKREANFFDSLKSSCLPTNIQPNKRIATKENNIA